MDMIGSGGDGLAVHIKGIKLCQKIGIGVPGLDPDFAFDAVGIDDASDLDHFQFHKGFSFV